MDHTALALKYRPTTFERVVGQDVLVRFFSELIRRGKIGRNGLIHGPYGSGKTTTARIYAKALNCASPAESGSPCGVCENCVQFGYDGASFPDYTEFDGATYGTKEGIVGVVEVARQPPMFGDKRIIVIDEAQGVSKAGFDALLKIVEEPPPFLVFMFTTTEKDKIRPAVASRCQDFEVRLLELETAKAHLAWVCGQEGWAFEPEALDVIAHVSHGHPRDLMKNLEQVAIMGAVTLNNAKLSFSLDFVDAITGLAASLFSGDLSGTLAALRPWAESPGRKLQVVQEFFLFMLLRKLGLNVIVNPVFDAIPSDTLGRLNGMLVKRADAGQTTLDALLHRITDHLATVKPVTADVMLDMELVRLFQLVAVNNFTNARAPVPNQRSGSSKLPLNARRSTREGIAGDGGEPLVPMEAQPVPQVPQFQPGQAEPLPPIGVQPTMSAVQRAFGGAPSVPMSELGLEDFDPSEDPRYF